MEDAHLDTVDLESAGWQQGDLLPALSWGVNFLPSHPATDLSRAEGNTQPVPSAPGTPPHAVAVGLLPPDRYLVLASQTCDIIKPISADPTVLALGAFVCDDNQILSQAATNSVRYLLLDPAKRIVVDATIQVVIEKPLLASLQRQGGPATEDIRIQFARWFGRRFSRPALPDDVQNYVVGPIGRAIRKARGKNTDFGKALDEALGKVRDIRFVRLAGPPPFDIRLLFIVDKQHQPAVVATLADLTARLRDLLARTGSAQLVAADTVDLYEISAGQLSDTDRLYLEDISYHGGQIDGDLPDLEDDESWI